MGNYTCLHGTQQEIKTRFLNLPKELFGRTLYIKETSGKGKTIRIPSFCDKKLERSILEGTHVLSKEFQVMPFIVIDADTEKTVSRALVTLYANDELSYVGFFESIDEDEPVQMLMDEIAVYAKENGKKALAGPLDASFWIKYRFKLNHFDKTYTGEPLNPPYYPKLWEKAGFFVSDHYYSNLVRIPTREDVNEKCVKRLAYINEKGYEIKHPTNKSFTEDLFMIYDSLIQLFSTFPGFHFINKGQFLDLNGSLKYVLDFDYVELATKDGDLKGFMISIPNYDGYTNGRLTLPKILHILKVKKKPKEYITLYMGVEPDSVGLGGAFAEILRQKMEKDQVRSVAALIHDGKETGHYYEELHDGKIEYAFYKKEL